MARGGSAYERSRDEVENVSVEEREGKEMQGASREGGAKRDGKRTSSALRTVK